MSNDNWSVTDSVGVIAPANDSRGVLTIQHYSGDPVYLGFGDEVPESGKGVRLSATFPLLTISDYRAWGKVSGICASTDSCNGGINEA